MQDVVAVVSDLFFRARIVAAAQAAGRTIRYVADPADLPALCKCRLALVDLDARVDALEAIRVLRASGSETIVAFGPHVDTVRRKAARSAGADRVLAKSKFATDLPRLLAVDGKPVSRR